MPTNVGPIAVWDLRLTYDYGQIYFERAYTADRDDDEFDDDDEDSSDRGMRLLNESFDSPHHVGYAPTHVVLNTEHRGTYDAPLRVELWAGPLPDDLGDWAEVWEFSLSFGKEGVYLSSATCGGVQLPPIPPGTYGFRMSMAGTEHGRWNYPSLDEHWLLQLWPVPAPFEARMPRTLRPARSPELQAAFDALGSGPSISNPNASIDPARAVVRTSPFPEVRQSALWQFTEQRGEAEALWRDRAVEDSSPEVRATALGLIGFHAQRDSLPDAMRDTVTFLLERGDADPDPVVRRSVVERFQFSHRDDPRVLPWLRSRLSDRSPAVRSAALRAVARLEVDYPPTWSDDPGLTGIMREFAERDPDPDLRRFAGLALADGWTHDEQVVAWLRDRAIGGPDPVVAADAVAAIAARMSSADLLPWLRQRVRDERRGVRAAAVATASSLWPRDAAARAWVRELVENDAHPDVRTAAVRVIADNLPAATAVDDLQLLLRERAGVDPDAGVRWAAIVALPEGLARANHQAGRPHHAVLADTYAWRERALASERDLLTLVLAQQGPVLPAAPPSAPTWERLLELMASGPDLPIRGAIRCRDSGHGVIATVSTHDEPAVIAGMRYRGAPEGSEQPLHVWWSGRRLRLAEPDGSVELIADDKRCWQFVDRTEVPITARRRALTFQVSGTELLTRRQAVEWQRWGTQPMGPIEATSFLGRPAWAVSVAESPDRALRVVVDADTGVLLQRSRSGRAGVDEWVEFAVVEELDDALFIWNGASRSAKEWEEAQRAAGVDLANRSARWFSANVPTRALQVTVAMPLTVYTVDEATGAFTAGLGSIGMVARRPHSATRWDDDWAVANASHRWRSDRWDWALTFHGVEPTAESVEAIKRRLAEDCD